MSRIRQRRVEPVSKVSALLLLLWIVAFPAYSGEQAPQQVLEVTTYVCDTDTLAFQVVDEKNPTGELTAEIWKLPKKVLHHPGKAATCVAKVSLECLGNYDLCLWKKADLKQPLRKGEDYVVRFLRASQTAEELYAVGSFDTKGTAELKTLHAERFSRYRLSLTNTTAVEPVVGPVKLRVKPEHSPEWVVDEVEWVNTPPEITDICDPDAGSQHFRVTWPEGRPPLVGSVLTLEGLKDVFGQEVVAKGKAISLAPMDEKSASAYLALSYLGSEEKSDSFALDLKLAPALQIRENWQFGPRLTADVSRNADSPNSIGAGFEWRHTSFFDYSVLPMAVWSLSIGAEADRDLDRVNGVATAVWLPRLPVLEHSREIRWHRKAKPLSLDAVEPPRWGWGLEPELGVEFGRALSTQTFRDPSTDQRLEVDVYDILRANVGGVAYFETETWRLNVTGVLRYLSETELTAGKDDDGNFFLRSIEGVEPYLEAKLSHAIGPAGHQALVVIYKNGALPPTFDRIESYSIGIEVKY